MEPIYSPQADTHFRIIVYDWLFWLIASPFDTTCSINYTINSAYYLHLFYAMNYINMYILFQTTYIICNKHTVSSKYTHSANIVLTIC